jgi:hypothetical protein
MKTLSSPLINRSLFKNNRLFNIQYRFISTQSGSRFKRCFEQFPQIQKGNTSFSDTLHIQDTDIQSFASGLSSSKDRSINPLIDFVSGSDSGITCHTITGTLTVSSIRIASKSIDPQKAAEEQTFVSAIQSSQDLGWPKNYTQLQIIQGVANQDFTIAPLMQANNLLADWYPDNINKISNSNKVEVDNFFLIYTSWTLKKGDIIITSKQKQFLNDKFVSDDGMNGLEIQDQDGGENIWQLFISTDNSNGKIESYKFRNNGILEKKVSKPILDIIDNEIKH